MNRRTFLRGAVMLNVVLPLALTSRIQALLTALLEPTEVLSRSRILFAERMYWCVWRIN